MACGTGTGTGSENLFRGDTKCPFCTPCILPILGQKWHKLQLHKPRYGEVKRALLCSGINFSEARGEFWKSPLAPPARGAPRAHAPRPRFRRVYLLGPEKGEKPASPAAGPRPLLGGRGRAGRTGAGARTTARTSPPPTAGAGRDPETGRDRPGIRTVPGPPALRPWPHTGPRRPSAPSPDPSPGPRPPSPARPHQHAEPAAGRRRGGSPVSSASERRRW